MSDPVRSRRARDLAERALVRLIHAYGVIPEFVLIGGLVPDLLCRTAARPHQGTTDVDVQVDLEIQGGSVNSERLERALTDCGFTPDSQKIWRWRDKSAPELVVKIEFLADLADVADHITVSFDGCESLGAVNLRGTGFAARDWTLHSITSTIDGEQATVQLRVATLPAYLLAKTHAAHGRGLPKDWYDIAYVLLHNDAGGPSAAAQQVVERFAPDLVGATATALGELSANFDNANAQGSFAFATTMVGLHPDLDFDVLANDAVAAVRDFVGSLAMGRMQ
jgi:Nucleotidyl transferase AbiEii toxin, Type IV TA system